ncbi:redox-regulated ATPase YchF [Candidatus Uhrbacteria bacterium CG10_big_fil_rev_8_21_14_0_10_50_16]|uniref:Ribosome-binding ATPase YchF n=1 Tax=Candidatus Uhrbacteria bacterium CG10_big_fil_rev_8_21_14_0_10_50_16 TaxID=1975039 RepID=A0A2H0RMU6_9BACT|nr:MAG: redox-regulated ATPase YchF [Candidatus Uhrbacteria bacterium CG10_big_fil_rev_8_21_14_0_10_50_16]
MLSVGIVGLPNVGKSTLFRTLTKKQVDCANFPFCTIEPNVGVVEVPDERLKPLSNASKSEKCISAAIEFVDIAGLVRGASKGEGLGNKFLGNIREVDAICHVVRSFINENVVHVDGAVDPVRDVETIELELALSDLESMERQIDRQKTKMKSGADKDEKKRLELMERIYAVLAEGRMATTVEMTDEERTMAKSLFLLTGKPVIYIVNVSEQDAADPNWVSPLGEGRTALPICIQLESDLVELSEEERVEYLEAVGLKQTALDRLIRTAFETLDLITYFTSGEKETRAWQIPRGLKAPQAAAVIHTDFEKAFIRAEIISFEDYVTLGRVGSREAGRERIEGKEYVMRDGDVCYFRLNS